MYTTTVLDPTFHSSFFCVPHNNTQQNIRHTRVKVSQKKLTYPSFLFIHSYPILTYIYAHNCSEWREKKKACFFCFCFFLTHPRFSFFLFIFVELTPRNLEIFFLLFSVHRWPRTLTLPMVVSPQASMLGDTDEKKSEKWTSKDFRPKWTPVNKRAHNHVEKQAQQKKSLKFATFGEK